MGKQLLLKDIFQRSLLPAIALGLTLAAATAHGGQPGGDRSRSEPSVGEWMRGVPCGARVFSVILAKPPGAVEPAPLGRAIDVVWTYPSAHGALQKEVLFRDLRILRDALTGSRRKSRLAVQRATVALTPREADRLEVAIATGRLHARRASGNQGPSGDRLTWEVTAIEDRTAAVEADLASVCDRLERPTLVDAERPVAMSKAQTILVPVEVRSAVDRSAGE